MSENDKSSSGGRCYLLLLTVVGFLLVYCIENRTVAAEIVVAITFGANALAIALPNLQSRRRQVTRLTSALLFGALSAILFA